MRAFVLTSALIWPALVATAANAQQAADYADPLVRKDARERPPIEPQPTVTVAPAVPPAPVAPPAQGVFVGAVVFSGLQALAPADFADIVAPRLGRDWSPSDFTEFSTAVAKRLRAKGYAFATASVEAQRVAAGVLRVRVDEGRIDELRFEGEATPALRRALAPLIAERALPFSEVERRLMLAGDIDGTRIESSRFVREDDRGILVVRVSRDRVWARIGFNNAGTKPTGPEQARVEIGLNGLFASDDSLSMIYSTAPAQPRELQFGYLRYEKRLNASGTELALIASASSVHPGAYLAPLEIRNRSWYVAATVLQPLVRSQKASFWLEGGFGLRDLAQWRAGARVRDDRVATARLTLYGYRDVAGGRARVSGTVTQGLGVLGASRAGEPLLSRFDADGTFTTVNAWADWTRDLGGKFSVRFAAQGQLSSQPLLISEETSLGGTGFLRGYDWGERSGDEGVMGMAELRYLWDRPLGFVKRAQLYAFLDAGKVSNLDGGFGGGSLASAGGGMRVDVSNRLGLTFEVAVPLSGPRYDTGDSSPRLNFGLVRAF